ncbi:hypothetical protein AAIB33_01035 [Microbacterium sp. AZCO]|uniref:hypothetical protein n=1 Tax=Microbacterium sp. AZCO TaxID=3142976 RepID=UPI0031F44982
MSREGDVTGRRVSGPARYDFGARGPVFAAAVTRDGEVVAFLFHGDEDEPDAAGLMAAPGAGFEPTGSGYWLGELARLCESGVPAAEAVQGLLETSGPPVAGTVGTELRRYSGKHELKAMLDPKRMAADRAVRDSRTVPLRDRVDAALRGETPATKDVLGQIERLDAALAVKPTPDAVVVTLTPPAAVIPEDLAPGMRVFEPSFLTTYLTSSPEALPTVRRLVLLRVPAGVPALFTEASVPGGPGVLLLGRGIEWEVLRVLAGGRQEIITAKVVDRRPGPLAEV